MAQRLNKDKSNAIDDIWCGAGGTLFHLSTGRPARLTTMQLDGNSMNYEEGNLVTACRPCHAAHDTPQVAAARANARRWDLLDAGQLEIFPHLI